MKALELKTLMSSGPMMWQTNIKKHKKNLSQVKPMIDNTPPASIKIVEEAGSPMRKIMADQDYQEKVTRENLFLAKRIFDIMEGPGMVADIIKDSKNVDLHPGTLNFNRRLAEARRIHNENMAFATRLDSMKPFYGKVDLSVVRKMKKRNQQKKPKKTAFLKGLAQALETVGNQQSSSLSPELKSTNHGNFGGGGGSGRGDSASSAASSKKPQNVLLEYSKVQNGRVLDVAVMKEPFRDRYAIFGIDIDNGQRYELRLTSGDVSSILDGDILVTSVDHVEVWMALLNKVDLNPVQAFAKISTGAGVAVPTSLPGSPVVVDRGGTPLELGRGRDEGGPQTSGDDDDGSVLIMDSARQVIQPAAPSTIRPSSRPGGRPGSRPQREVMSGTNNNNPESEADSFTGSNSHGSRVLKGDVDAGPELATPRQPTEPSTPKTSTAGRPSPTKRTGSTSGQGGASSSSSGGGGKSGTNAKGPSAPVLSAPVPTTPAPTVPPLLIPGSKDVAPVAAEPPSSGRKASTGAPASNASRSSSVSRPSPAGRKLSTTTEKPVSGRKVSTGASPQQGQGQGQGQGRKASNTGKEDLKAGVVAMTKDLAAKTVADAVMAAMAKFQ